MAIAYRRELVAMRRLARREALPLETALQQVLRAAAGGLGLETLISRRQAEADEQQARRETAQMRHAEHRARRTEAEAVAADCWQAWFDGTCHPNPGRMAIGALLQSPGGVQTEISMTVGAGDSSEAEYRALIALLQAAIGAQVQKLVIHGDSRVIIDDVQASDGGGSRLLHTLRAEAQQLLAAIPQVTWRWIPRRRNAAADALSQAAIKGRR